MKGDPTLLHVPYEKNDYETVRNTVIFVRNNKCKKCHIVAPRCKIFWRTFSLKHSTGILCSERSSIWLCLQWTSIFMRLCHPLYVDSQKRWFSEMPEPNDECNASQHIFPRLRKTAVSCAMWSAAKLHRRIAHIESFEMMTNFGRIRTFIGSQSNSSQQLGCLVRLNWWRSFWNVFRIITSDMSDNVVSLTFYTPVSTLPCRFIQSQRFSGAEKIHWMIWIFRRYRNIATHSHFCTAYSKPAQSRASTRFCIAHFRWVGDYAHTERLQSTVNQK